MDDLLLVSAVERDRAHVTTWLGHLEDDLERFRLREEKWKGERTWEFHGARWDIERRRTEILHEVISRGLDPKQTRRFNGRVLLTIRCVPRGHTLAYVYPTSRNSVLIPTASALRPIKADRRRQQDFEAAQRRRSLDPLERLLFLPRRDPWVEVYGGDPDYRPTFNIRGLSILDATHRQEAIEVDGVARTPAFFLLCRCGQRVFPTSDVMNALDSGLRVLTA